MSDIAGSLGDYSIPPNVSDDVEMTAPHDIKGSERRESESNEQQMEDLFGNDEDHAKDRSVSPPSHETVMYLITSKLEQHRLLPLARNQRDFLLQKESTSGLWSTRKKTHRRKLRWRSRKPM